MDRDTSTMSFGDHLEDLRKRLFYALLGPIPILIVCLAFGGPILEFIVIPLETQLRASGQPVRLLATSPIESFGAYLKVAMAVAVLVSAPWILYQAWLFVAPGLYQNEKRFVYFLMPASAVLTATAMVFLYTVMLPVMLRFFIVFGSLMVQTNVATAPLPDDVTLPEIPVLSADPVSPEPGAMWLNGPLHELRFAIPDAAGALSILRIPLDAGGTIAQQYRIGEYVNLVFGLAIVFAVAFQLPIAMLLLGWTGILRPEDLRPWRKHALFVCVVASAIFTPADPGSMVLLAAPLYLLFEIGLVLMQFVTPARVAGAGSERRSDDDAG